MTQPQDPSELETAVRTVYRGPLEEFISRRDALAKELRSAKRREDADRVKALRKPSRTAWVLDSIAHEDPTPIEQLAAVIGAAQTVSSGADLRAALENVRGAVRDVAAAGARIAIRAGQPIDANALSTAVLAIIGDSSAFSDLRAGRLVDVPDGGGLDILTAISIVPTSPPAVARPAPEPPKPQQSASTAAQDEARAVAARAELRRAETALAEAREQSRNANELVRSAQAQLDAAAQAVSQAEQMLSRANESAAARRADVERARQTANNAEAQVRDAERAVASARTLIR